MKRKMLTIGLVALLLPFAVVCGGEKIEEVPMAEKAFQLRVDGKSQEAKDQAAVDRQQKQYAKAQPIPTYDWSLERDLVIQLYNIRNQRVATHSVWRSNYGMVEGDCPSMGYGLPYDTSLTNPWRTIWNSGNGAGGFAGVAIGQAEPNGVFASTNTSATWVMCVGLF